MQFYKNYVYLLVVNPRMITLAREARGYTQRSLCKKLGITTSMMSRAEKSDPILKPELLQNLSMALKYPKDFFYQEGGPIPTVLGFRQRQSVSQKVITPVIARINIYRFQIQKLHSLLNWKINTKRFFVTDTADPNKAAKEIRRRWNVPKGPINDLTELIEREGIIVVKFSFGTERVDSRTILTPSGQPIIFLNKTLLGDRLRFSLAYELAHICMHVHGNVPSERDIRHEANLFAAELLLPSDDFIGDISEELTIAKIGELKRKWGVSMQAILYRTNDIGRITDNQKRYLLEQFNTLNIRRREPPELDVKIESSGLLHELVKKYSSKSRLNNKKMAKIFNLNYDEFVESFSEP